MAKLFDIAGIQKSHAHEVVKCACGKILKNCRCSSVSKSVKTVSPCKCRVPVFKSKDASGHEHDSKNGQFVSSGGHSYDTRSKNGRTQLYEGVSNSLGEDKALVGATKQEEKGWAAVHAGQPGKRGQDYDSKRIPNKDGGEHHPSEQDAMNALTAHHEHVNGISPKPGSHNDVYQNDAKLRDKHTDAHGNVAHDEMAAERHKLGLTPATQTNRREAVFMIGGGGSGKGAFVRQYIGTEPGQKDRAGNAITAGHPDYVRPKAGFEGQHVFDADREKKKFPLYSDTEQGGKYGPSGPKTWDDLAKYTPEEQKAVRDYVLAETGMTLDDFSKLLADENGKQSTLDRQVHFGGGLTHEVSSFTNKRNFLRALTSNEHPSFVYDAVGSSQYPQWAEEAKKHGYTPVFHHVDTPPEIAQHHNSERSRKVEPSKLEATHAKVERVLPLVRDYMGSENGGGVEFRHDRPWTQGDLSAAHAAGFTRHGKTNAAA